MKLYLLTENKYKSLEIIKIFKGYGLTITPIKSKQDKLFNSEEKYIVLREETQLRKNDKVIKTEELNQLDCVEHYSTFFIVENTSDFKFHSNSYLSKVSGFIDYSKRFSNEDVYNWDDIFIELETMQSYQEMKKRTNKFSARTQSVSSFIKEFNKFEKKIDLKFNPLNQKNVLLFSNQINEFIDTNKYLSNYKNNPLLKGLITHVKNEGLFTRSALNKSQRNYWYPSLNAGLPLVPKQDEIHEVTFMFHDLMHHVMPDLILSGNDTKEIRDAYIIYRMLSEAITIVFADMIFVDELVMAGHEYDWTKRKIYPIYKEFKKKGTYLERIKELVWANVNFALLGDDSKLIALSNKEVVENYTQKYEKFFIEDYRWTLNNYENMNLSVDAISNWFSEIVDLVPANRVVNRYSESIRNVNGYEERVSTIFEKVWLEMESKVETTEVLPKEITIKNAFKNYMVGQSFAFFKLKKTADSEYLFSLIKKELLGLESVKPSDIYRIRKFFNIYIEKLNKKNIISDLEKECYIEIFPIFEPFFVFYERELKYESIKSVVASLIK